MVIRSDAARPPISGDKDPKGQRMAGAEAACAAARAGTILGVTRSPAPSFHLKRTEPLLRLSVPTLLGIFLVTLGVCAFFQIGQGRREALGLAAADVDVVATLAALAAQG